MATKQIEQPETDAKKVDRLIYTTEVAKRYGIHPQTALRFAKEGKIPPPLKSAFGNGPCWRESDIDRHLESLE